MAIFKYDNATREYSEGVLFAGKTSQQSSYLRPSERVVFIVKDGVLHQTTFDKLGMTVQQYESLPSKFEGEVYRDFGQPKQMSDASVFSQTAVSEGVTRDYRGGAGSPAATGLPAYNTNRDFSFAAEAPQQATSSTTTGSLSAFSSALANGASDKQAQTAYDTGNPVFDETLKVTQAVLDQLQKNGQVLNPNVEITPEKLAEFTRIAQNEIEPYYASQLKLAREGFLRSVGYSQEKLLQSEAELEKKYGQQVRQLGESAADRGFAQSGLRQRDERDLATDTQNTINTNRRELSFNAGTAARTFAQQYGADQLSSPNITEAPRALAGQGSFAKSSRELPFYELSSDTYDSIVGENEFLKRSQVRSRASELEGAFRSDLALNQARTLNFT